MFNKVSPEVAKRNVIENELKYMIYFEALTGVNRIYLLKCSKCSTNFISVYNFVLFIISTLTYNLIGLFNTSQRIYKNTQLVEYLLLCICAVFRQKTPLENFFQSLNNVDKLLNIESDIAIVTPKFDHLSFLFIITMFNVSDLVISYIYYRHPAYNVWSFFVSYLTVAVNDIEVLFFCTLLIMVLKRLTILHAHVTKQYLPMDSCNKLTVLAKNVSLDVTSLHKIYEMLLHSSSVLQKIIGFPLLILFTSSGIITIMLLRSAINPHLLQDLSPEYVHSLWIYVAAKCIKHGSLVLAPCYYGGLTIRQARRIRCALKRVLAETKCDVRSRRRLKAFSQLARDNEFGYALWGYIRLDMTLPLSYYYVCLTYFVIVVQFAKFFD